MKISPGVVYKNKVTGRIVIVQDVNGNMVTFNERGKPGQPTVRSIQDFKLKYEVSKRRKPR